MQSSFKPIISFMSEEERKCDVLVTIFRIGRLYLSFSVAYYIYGLACSTYMVHVVLRRMLLY